MSPSRTRPPRLSRRKAEGVFYTPAFITHHIAGETLGRVFEERWKAIVAAEGPSDAAFRAYRDELGKIRVLDPACGEGVFLIAAFEALLREHDRIDAALSDPSFDAATTILEKNLFGIDLDAESVERTKQCLRLEATKRGRTLGSLDAHIRCGNSVVQDPEVDPAAFDWTSPAFREGFDVVLGNPPYVRQERIARIKAHLEKTYRAHHGMADLFVYFFERGIDVLKPGGRLGFIVANKWLKSGYAEPLRRLLAAEATIETIVDFGHAPIFPDADAFPCTVTLAKRKPAADADVAVTMFPREALQSSAIPHYVAQHRYAVPRARLGAGPWILEPPAVDALVNKIRAAGRPLSHYAGGKPRRGILTGFNEAFLIDEATKEKLCEDDPRSAEILRRYVRGKDIGRWSTEWEKTWMIFARRGIDIATYPAVERHLARYKASLEPRPRASPAESWPGRKPGNYQWFELQDTIDYWKLLESPKIIYQEIQFHPAYSLDTSGLFVTNKVFFLPTCDKWLLAVLNSPLMWWYCFRFLPHMKDETLSPVGAMMVDLPIAEPASKTSRERAEAAVTRLCELGKLEASALECRREALALERRLGELVDEAYGLEPEDVALLFRTAPPRMPFEAQRPNLPSATESPRSSVACVDKP